MVKPEDESRTLTRLNQRAVQSFGAVDLQVKHGHDILLHVIKKYKNPLFDVTKPLTIQFIVADEIRIGGGGITKECFHLLVESLKQKFRDGVTLLKGSLGHLCPKHDPELLLSGMFIIMGNKILHAVLNNCQGISGTSLTLLKYIVTSKQDAQDISIEDIPDSCPKEQLE